MLKLRHPFFMPIWPRAATTLVAVSWAVFELATGSVFWSILFGAVAAWCFYEFFIVFDPADYEGPDG